MIALYENQPVSARVRLTDDDYLRTRYYLHPDGTADYIRHQPQELDHGVRWICRTPDQDALGMVLPETPKHLQHSLFESMPSESSGNADEKPSDGLK